jgi:hypoxanthine phosphoribosyltransferase
MPWEDYWSRIVAIQEMIKRPIDDGRYVPHALVGLSNGGMMIADLLGRSLFLGKPVTSMWVNRWDVKGDWFNNPINSSLIEALKKIAPKSTPLDLLLVDDIVASGKTVKEALNYLGTSLKTATIKFLPIFTANEKYLKLIQDNLVWSHDAFSEIAKSGKAFIDATHRTKYRMLPYGKDIRSA